VFEEAMRDLISFDQLAEVMSALHDCPFDLDRAVFSEETLKWTGTFFRPRWDDPAAEHAGWALVYGRSRLPVAEAFVGVANVAATSVLDDVGIGRYNFNQVERTRDGIRLCFNEAMRIELRLAGPVHATYEERVSSRLRAVYRQFLLVQSGPRIEEVVEIDAR
jgi:hypothetical protein